MSPTQSPAPAHMPYAPPHTPDAPTLAELYGPIADDLHESQRVLRAELISDQGFICDLVSHVSQFHGKLLRPALLLLVGRACGRVTRDHHVLAGVVELVHVATLVHDDVLDEADIRRRAATVNRLWGNERAVLMGDYLISHAFHLCSSLETTHASRVIGHATNTVCEGEMMQVANRDNYELTEREYLDIIGRKTAALIGACCQLGAHYAGAAERVVAQAREFGESLGVAFQIVDDLLDFAGEESEMGKTIGRDVHKGKLTLPLIHYLREADDEGRGRALAILRGQDPQRYRQIAALLARSSSVEYAQAAAAHHIERAGAALAALPDSAARQSLATMAGFVLARKQ